MATAYINEREGHGDAIVGRGSCLRGGVWQIEDGKNQYGKGHLRLVCLGRTRQTCVFGVHLDNKEVCMSSNIVAYGFR